MSATEWITRSELGHDGWPSKWAERANPDRPGWVDLVSADGIAISGRVGISERDSQRLSERHAERLRSRPAHGDVIRSGGTLAIADRGSSRRTSTATRSRSVAPPPARKTPTSRVDRVFIRPDAVQQLHRFRLIDGVDDLAILETGGSILGHQSGSDLFVTGFREDMEAERHPKAIAHRLKHFSAAGDALIGCVHTHPRLYDRHMRQQYSQNDAETWRRLAHEFGKPEWLGVIASPTMTEWGQSELSGDAWETLTLDAWTCTPNGTVTRVPVESH